MRISDWSSDVFSSDLRPWMEPVWSAAVTVTKWCLPTPSVDVSTITEWFQSTTGRSTADDMSTSPTYGPAARTSAVWGTTVSVRVDLGGRRMLKKKKISAKKLTTTEKRTIQQET